jgi:uncharacterized membrane protein
VAKADFFDRAEDAINATRYLKTLPEIDSTKIGLVVLIKISVNYRRYAILTLKHYNYNYSTK